MRVWTLDSFSPCLNMLEVGAVGEPLAIFEYDWSEGTVRFASTVVFCLRWRHRPECDRRALDASN